MLQFSLSSASKDLRNLPNIDENDNFLYFKVLGEQMILDVQRSGSGPYVLTVTVLDEPEGRLPVCSESPTAEFVKDSTHVQLEVVHNPPMTNEESQLDSSRIFESLMALTKGPVANAIL